MSGIDYHVEVKPHFYSVPHSMLREKMWARYTERTVEVFHHGNRITVHPRIPLDGRKHSTLSEHMPSSHRRRRAGRTQADLDPLGVTISHLAIN